MTDEDDDDEFKGYRIEVSKVYNHGESVERLYERTIRELSNVEAPWVPKDVSRFPLRKYDGLESMYFSFPRKSLKLPLESFVLNFANRSRTGVPKFIELHDDYLIAAYRPLPDGDSYARMVTSVFPKFLAALDAAFGQVGNWDIEFEDGDARDESDEVLSLEEIATKIQRIWAANFWSDSLCRTAFGLSAADVVKRLKNEVAEARLYRGGAFIISSYEEPTADEVRALDARLRPLLTE